MRRLFTTTSSGLTLDALRWGEHVGKWRRVQRGVYADGPAPITELDRERAKVLAAEDGVARGALSGLLLGLDVDLDGRPLRRGVLPPHRIVVVDGTRCADAMQTLIDLAATLDDDRWEQVLESTLRKRLVTIGALEELTIGRVRRVLARRPPAAPPTESLLETLALQLARTVPDLGEPVRQHVVRWPDGEFVARVDLCWPEDTFFVELDGQHHKNQPVYDARRETAVVAATGWLPGRFTWDEITRTPNSSARRLGAIVEQARRRRPAA